MALQFENLVLNNCALVIEALGLSAVDVLNAAPYFQTATQERRGAQVDLLIQERFGSLFVCEISSRAVSWVGSHHRHDREAGEPESSSLNVAAAGARPLR